MENILAILFLGREMLRSRHRSIRAEAQVETVQTQDKIVAFQIEERPWEVAEDQLSCEFFFGHYSGWTPIEFQTKLQALTCRMLSIVISFILTTANRKKYCSDITSTGCGSKCWLKTRMRSTAYELHWDIELRRCEFRLIVRIVNSLLTTLNIEIQIVSQKKLNFNVSKTPPKIIKLTWIEMLWEPSLISRRCWQAVRSLLQLHLYRGYSTEFSLHNWASLWTHYRRKPSEFAEDHVWSRVRNTDKRFFTFHTLDALTGERMSEMMIRRPELRFFLIPLLCSSLLLNSELMNNVDQLTISTENVTVPDPGSYRTFHTLYRSMTTISTSRKSYSLL